MTAVAAAQLQEAMSLYVTCDEGVELVFDELRQVGAGSVFGLGKEGRGVLLHQAVKRGLFRAVTLVVNWGAVRRPRIVGRWLARESPEVVSSHGFKPRATPRSPCAPPTGACPPLQGLLRGLRFGSDQQLRGDGFRIADVSEESKAVISKMTTYETSKKTSS